MLHCNVRSIAVTRFFLETLLSVAGFLIRTYSPVPYGTGLFYLLEEVFLFVTRDSESEGKVLIITTTYTSYTAVL